jgi:hypothetical protein
MKELPNSQERLQYMYEAARPETKQIRVVSIQLTYYRTSSGIPIWSSIYSKTYQDIIIFYQAPFEYFGCVGRLCFLSVTLYLEVEHNVFWLERQFSSDRTVIAMQKCDRRLVKCCSATNVYGDRSLYQYLIEIEICSKFRSKSNIN